MNTTTMTAAAALITRPVPAIEFTDPNIETIGMSASGEVCFPGNSLNAPGGEHSYGNPLHDTGDLETLSGPQELVGQKGTYDVRFAGAALRGVYSFE